MAPLTSVIADTQLSSEVSHCLRLEQHCHLHALPHLQDIRCGRGRVRTVHRVRRPQIKDSIGHAFWSCPVICPTYTITAQWLYYSTQCPKHINIDSTIKSLPLCFQSESGLLVPNISNQNSLCRGVLDGEEGGERRRRGEGRGLEVSVGIGIARVQRWSRSHLLIPHATHIWNSPEQLVMSSYSTYKDNVMYMYFI